MTGYLASIARNRTRSALGGAKGRHTDEYLGCTYDFLRNWIECQFHSGMSWDNCKDWHVDHIEPIKMKGHEEPGVLDRRLHYTKPGTHVGFREYSQG